MMCENKANGEKMKARKASVFLCLENLSKESNRQAAGSGKRVHSFVNFQNTGTKWNCSDSRAVHEHNMIPMGHTHRQVVPRQWRCLGRF